MHISFTFKNFEPSEHLSKYARRRLEKLGRFLGKNPALDTQVLMTVDKFRQKVEVQIAGEGLSVSASESSEDMYATIDLVLDKLEAQVKKYVSRTKEVHRKARNNADIGVYTYDMAEGLEEDRSITDRDHFSPKPMDPEEAALQLEAKGFEFLVFLNSENERVNVIYRRKDNNYGMIDPII